MIFSMALGAWGFVASENGNVLRFCIIAYPIDCGDLCKSIRGTRMVLLVPRLRLRPKSNNLDFLIASRLELKRRSNVRSASP